MSSSDLGVENAPNTRAAKELMEGRNKDGLPSKEVIEYLTAFTLTNEKYIGKRIDLVMEREKLAAFRRYIDDDKVEDKLSRGMSYLLWTKRCRHENAVEAFAINAYEERDAIETVKQLRKDRDELKERYRKLVDETIQQQTRMIHLKRMARTECSEPRVVARSSGHPSNSYVHGYGYAYGIGYTDDCKTSTAPGFELIATKHMQQVVKTISPSIGQGDFHKLYKVMFNIKPKNQKLEEHS